MTALISTGLCLTPNNTRSCRVFTFTHSFVGVGQIIVAPRNSPGPWGGGGGGGGRGGGRRGRRSDVGRRDGDGTSDHRGRFTRLRAPGEVGSTATRATRKSIARGGGVFASASSFSCPPPGCCVSQVFPAALLSLGGRDGDPTSRRSWARPPSCP